MQFQMSNSNDVWDLNIVGELRDQVINLSIILVRMLRKIAKHTSISAELLKLFENRYGTGSAYGYHVHLKTDALCIQCLLEYGVKPLEGFPIVITICDEVDFRSRDAVFLDLTHHRF
jgi:hypothetical protein